tara:strand:- start:410 stop:589 length:180 start_codon:yes stop_codon:yes gene_type:complete
MYDIAVALIVMFLLFVFGELFLRVPEPSRQPIQQELISQNRVSTNLRSWEKDVFNDEEE